MFGNYFSSFYGKWFGFTVKALRSKREVIRGMSVFSKRIFGKSKIIK